MSVYVTRSFIRASFTPEFEEGDEITEKNAYGEVCVTFKSPDTLKRVNLELAVCEPDPMFSRLIGGGDLIFDCGPGADPNDLVGYMSVEVGKEPNPNGVSIELLVLGDRRRQALGQQPVLPLGLPLRQHAYRWRPSD